ncbi:Uncharacterized protein FWK35_00033456 [Aphis craccivora]|uniref:MD-2-related lipid-recognition domain-containing protein n=1 Tax=Aphis craccivora TaxID=307492 RepID=A0A6G0XB20_APHCR|nr:Uncharacterized protein FWK35_00033456 [Aphis craccivora]
MILIKVFIFFRVLLWVKSQYTFMPNLPLGEYRTVFDKIYHCESTKNHSIKLNLYFNKKTPNITEMKGNATYLIPLDDTLFLDANVASWSLTGGWKPNSAVYVTKNACSNMKKVLGNAWNSLLKGFNVPSTNCPIPVGTYTASGINVKELEDHNSPKVYFYGKYKLLFKIKNAENKVIACSVIEFRLLRPWENPLVI